MGCSHCQEFGPLADLASDWLSTSSCVANQEPACSLTQLLTMTTTHQFPSLVACMSCNCSSCMCFPEICRPPKKLKISQFCNILPLFIREHIQGKFWLPNKSEYEQKWQKAIHFRRYWIFFSAQKCAAQKFANCLDNFGLFRPVTCAAHVINIGQKGGFNYIQCEYACSTRNKAAP